VIEQQALKVQYSLRKQIGLKFQALDTYLKDGARYQNYLQKARLSLRLLCSFYNPLLKIRHESRLKQVKQTLK
jgi:hypothetical protein